VTEDVDEVVVPHEAEAPKPMTLSRIGGTASVLGAVAWLILFGPGTAGIRITWLEGLMWVFPLLFALGTIALWAGRAHAGRIDRAAAGLAGVTGALSAASFLAGATLTSGAGMLAYAAWLGFVGGIVLLCGLVVAFGARYRSDPADRRVARVALVAGALPFGYFLLLLGYKLATGWWVTDPTLIAIGSLGVAVLIGVGWISVGVALWVRPAPREGSVPELVQGER
jgi:hypothetical protein